MGIIGVVKTVTQGQRCCRAAIFNNRIRKNGETIDIPKVVITRRYLSKDNEWKSTNAYSQNDLPKLIMVATKAYDYLTSKRNKEPAKQ